jgi:ribosome-associated heat shock protein Hsp15
MTGTRLDKWLWAARFYKTRGLSTDEIERGRVSVNGQPAKPSREVRVGDRIDFRHPWAWRTVIVKDTSTTRGPAPVAQALYEETPDSIERRERAVAERRFAGEPADAYAAGRPTKRDRRRLADWHRWSASIDAD